MSEIIARHFSSQRPVRITLQGPHIADIQPIEMPEKDAADLPLVSPGFFDIQINGYNGKWFCSPDLTIDDVEDVTRALLEKGITRYFPTLITASHEALVHGFQTIRRACESRPVVAACVAGCHLEGPWISAEDGPRGAHPAEHVRPASIDEFRALQTASGGRIRLLTLAPEAENAIPLIEYCTSAGVVVSIGHTAADSLQIKAAVDAGARLSTHLGNGAHGQLRRHPNYIWDQLAQDRLHASVIADGWHLPQSVLKCFVRCKTVDRLILTCDASGFAGCRPGVYHEGSVAVEVLPDGRIVVAGQTQFLAGSGATTGDCIAHLVCSQVGVDLSHAVRMATTRPGGLFAEDIASLSIGDRADLVLFRLTPSAQDAGPAGTFQPLQTYLDGKTSAGAS